MIKKPFQKMPECKKIKWATKELAEEYLEYGKNCGHYKESHNVYFCLDCLKFHIGRDHSND